MEVVKIEKGKKEKPQPKARVEAIEPKDIVDVWKMLDRSHKEAPTAYPSIDEESPEVIRFHLFNFMSSPNFLGAILRVGRKPIGQIVAQVTTRPFGHPKAYLFIWNFWMEPEFRKQGHMKLLYKEFFARAKKMGIHHWEANASDELTETLTKYSGYETKKLMNRIGGKIIA